ATRLSNHSLPATKLPLPPTCTCSHSTTVVLSRKGTPACHVPLTSRPVYPVSSSTTPGAAKSAVQATVGRHGTARKESAACALVVASGTGIAISVLAARIWVSYLIEFGQRIAVVRRRES